MNKDEFLKYVSELGIFLDDQKMQKLYDFYKILIEYNQKINLTSIIKQEDVYLKHFFDSLTLIKVIDLTKNLKVLDVGTGAGIPGIVLKIVFPNLDITLLDSLGKRIKYLDVVINKLELLNIKTVCNRCEIYAKENRESYDLVIARAVSNLPTLIEICTPLVKISGYFIAMKGDLKDELILSKKIIKDVNVELDNIIEFNLPIENSKRALIKFKKIGICNVKYPRKYEQIKKSNCKK